MVRRDEELNHRVQGVYPLVRVSHGVSGLPVELDLHGAAGEAVGEHPVLRARMDHHGRIQPVEDSSTRENHLPADRLLGRRAEDKDFATEKIDEPAHGDACPDGGRCDEIVAAGMTQSRQSVVFGEKSDPHGGGRASRARDGSGPGSTKSCAGAGSSACPCSGSGAGSSVRSLHALPGPTTSGERGRKPARS